MDKNTANIALEFMKRVSLSGGEVVAWQQVVSALNSIIQAPDASNI